MRKITLAAVLIAGLALASCDDAAYRASEDDMAVEPTIDAPPMTAEDAGVPAAETAPPPAPPTDMTALPPDQRSSEETVQPESETLFY